MTPEDHLNLYTKEEGLLDELKPYVVVLPHGSKMLKHPLIYEMFLRETRAAHTNARYLYLKKEAEKTLREGKWDQFVWMHERPYRIAAFTEVMSRFTDREYWSELGHLWVDSENIWQNAMLWEDLLTNESRNLKLRYLLMDPEEREALHELPEKVTVFRGCCAHNLNGMSWTMDLERAKWFAIRFCQGKEVPLLLTGVVRRQDIVAMFLGRGEHEVVSAKVKIIHSKGVE